MNREIKFRAWDGNNMIDWLTLSQSAWNRDTSLLYRVMVSHSPDYFLMQYTGLKDKNGKEIYEGDILSDKENRVWKVDFDCGAFRKHSIGRSSLTLHESSGYLEIEVIGNIYENKELIEKIKG